MAEARLDACRQLVRVAVGRAGGEPLIVGLGGYQGKFVDRSDECWVDDGATGDKTQTVSTTAAMATGFLWSQSVGQRRVDQGCRDGGSGTCRRSDIDGLIAGSNDGLV